MRPNKYWDSNLTTNQPLLKILLIDNDPGSAERVRTALGLPDDSSFEVKWVRQLSEGLSCLGGGGIAAVLLDLSLPDGQGIETFDKLVLAAVGVPILILGENGNEALAVEAVARGAQDYILPGHVDSYSLPRALRNAIERRTFEDALFEERDRALVTLNSIGDAVLCTDISGNVTYLNLVAETLTGWNCKEAIGQPLANVFRIVDGATRETAQDPMQMAVDQNRTVGLTVNCVLIRSDGVESAIEDSAAPIHDRAGHALVTRTRDPLSGQISVEIGGLGLHASQAAAEFATNPIYIKSLSDSLHDPNRNVQIVLKINVIKGEASPPQVVAENYW
jgi:PAS domain S-box-containing protein